MFESKHQGLLSRPQFVRRVGFHLLLAGGIVTVGLGIGTLGYHITGGLNWIDALLNATMILTGMGPVDVLRNTSAKLFASAYALFSNMVFVSVIGLVLAPLFHRILHRFHLDQEVLPEDKTKK